MEQIKLRVAEIANGDDREAIRTLLNALIDAVNALAAKLDNDATVTDTDYAATVATFIQK